MSDPDGLERMYRALDTHERIMEAEYDRREAVCRTYTTIVESARLRKLLELLSLTRRMRKAQQRNLRWQNWESQREVQECERRVDDALARLD